MHSFVLTSFEPPDFDYYLSIYGAGGNDTIKGGTLDDSLYGQDGNDTILGDSGDDHIEGGIGNDILDGQEGRDTMKGGAGDDSYYINQANEYLTENANSGTDKVYTSANNFTLPANFEWLFLEGTVSSGTGNNLSNTLLGNNSANTFVGLDGDDTIVTNGGNDILVGNNGIDTLNGGDGNDVFNGGSGADTYFGGSGADDFGYFSVSDSPVGGMDKITDFNRTQGDRINLSPIDADLTLPGDQAFTVGTYVNGILTGDVIGGADIKIQLVGAPALNLSIDILP